MGLIHDLKSFRKATALKYGWLLLLWSPQHQSHGFSGINFGNSRADRVSKASVFERASSTGLTEPDESSSGLNYGRQAYWDESYKEYLKPVADGSSSTEEGFSWYCGWEEELAPFFSELVPDQESKILVPGVGNDLAIRDMFDSGYESLYAFDYAPEGIECARVMFGAERLKKMGDLSVADARDLPYNDNSFDAVLEKGTLDAIYLSGGNDKAKKKLHLSMAVSELERVVKRGGLVFSVSAACTEAVQEAFSLGEGTSWKQVLDGTPYITDDGYTSNNVDATMLAWERI